MVAEWTETDIRSRAERNWLEIDQIEPFDEDPTQSTNMKLRVDGKNLLVKNGTVKEVAYLFLSLDFDLQSINSIDNAYTFKQTSDLIKAIKKKLGEQKVVAQLQKTDVQVTNNSPVNIEEKLNTMTIEDETTVDIHKDSDDSHEKMTLNTAREDSEEIREKSFVTVDETDDTTDYIWIGVEVMKDIELMLTKLPENTSFATMKETLLRKKETLQGFINAQDNNNIAQELSSIMTLMEEIELASLQTATNTEASSVTESLLQDIQGVKEYDENTAEKGAIGGWVTAWSLEKAKQHLTWSNKFISTLQQRLQRIILFVGLEVGISTALAQVLNGFPSGTQHLTNIGIIGMAIVIWWFFMKRNLLTQTLSWIVLVILSIIWISLI